MAQPEFEYRVWDFFEDVAACAKLHAKFHNKAIRIVVVDGGWSIPGLRTEENEAGFNDGQPIRYARRLQAKHSETEYQAPDFSLPDKWTIESGDPLP